MSSEQDQLKETDTEERFAFKKDESAAVRSDKGLTEEVVRLISEDKDEPDWMLDRRLRALEHWQNMPMPTDWPGQPDLTELDVEEIVPYIRPDVDKREGADSGGSFVYVPEDVTVEMPVQAYFRMNSEGMGQFEHTLIIAEPGSEVHYIEGCSAPKYGTHNLHSGGVEVFVKEDAHVQYSTVQNWSKNTFNLNTKRAIVEKGGRMEWVSGSMGSKATMLYPCTILKGRGASANNITIAFAGEGQNIDTGAKVYHNAPRTKSTIESKSISKDGGRTNYRGLVHISEGAEHSSTAVECDALMFDNESTSDTMPYMEIDESKVDVAHEATVGKIGDEDVFYLQSRGLDDDDAKQMIVSGFIEPITEELPIEYAVELNRLIELEMEGSLG